MKAVVAREAHEEGRELDENGMPVDLKVLEGCPLETGVPATDGRGARGPVADC